MVIRVHGTGMDTDLCTDMFDNLITIAEEAKMITRDPYIYNEIDGISKNLLRISKFK